MEVRVDTDDGRVWLDGWDDFGSLSVTARIDRSTAESGREVAGLAAVLESDGSGRIGDDGAVRLAPDALMALADRAAGDAGESLGPEWRTSFEAMLDFARGNGWIDDDGAVRAHVEWKEI